MGARVSLAEPTVVASQYWTPQAIAERLAISRSLVYALIKRGDLAATWIGRCPRITEADLLAYLQRARRS